MTNNAKIEQTWMRVMFGGSEWTLDNVGGYRVVLRENLGLIKTSAEALVSRDLWLHEVTRALFSVFSTTARNNSTNSMATEIAIVSLLGQWRSMGVFLQTVHWMVAVPRASIRALFLTQVPHRITKTVTIQVSLQGYLCRPMAGGSTTHTHNIYKM